jgi:tripartite-type tricarboxylate transporter receptor subunit TctC
MQPNIPTMQDAGVPGFISQAFIGVTTPAQTPAAVIERLSKETARIMAMPDVRQRIAGLGMVPQSAAPEEYRAFLGSETKRNRKLITEAKLQFDN